MTWTTSGSYIAADSLDAADRVLGEIHQTIRALVAFPQDGAGFLEKNRIWLFRHTRKRYATPLPKQADRFSLFRQNEI